MAKIKGGLGETALIEDLSKPISFHVSESLEAPPPFHRQVKPADEGEREDVSTTAQPDSARFILNKASKILNERNVQILVRFAGKDDALLLESSLESVNEEAGVSAVTRSGGGHRSIPWDKSSFSELEPEKAFSSLAKQVSGIDVTTAGNVIKFSSIHDFFEWLD